MHTLAAFFSAIAMTIGSWFGAVPAAPVTVANAVPPAGTSAASATTANDSVPVTTHTTASAGSGAAGAGSSSADSAISIANQTLPAGSNWLTTLPLGDGKYSTTGSKKGYIYLCHIQSGGQGAQVNGPWIHGSTWNPSEKVHVEGNVSWPQATYHMNVANGTRSISSNDLPTNHTTGIFPIQASDPAAQYDRNQGTIAAHSYSFSLPANPTAAATPNCMYGEVGIMNNGVLLLDGFDALYRDALAHELQDDHDGHPNNEGYHKHGFITDIKNVSVSQVVGFAFDGYPITGPLLPSGKYLTTNDLDECHGMTSQITLDGKLQTSYHYVLTQDFPYSASCFHGTLKVTPNQLMSQSGPTAGQSGQTQGAQQGQMPQQGGGGTPPTPPQEAITACSGKASGASCSVGAQVTGTCQTVGTSFACIPAR